MDLDLKTAALMFSCLLVGMLVGLLGKVGMPRVEEFGFSGLPKDFPRVDKEGFPMVEE